MAKQKGFEVEDFFRQKFFSWVYSVTVSRRWK